MKRIMIDIETLGLFADAYILSIGACTFGEPSAPEIFYNAIFPGSQPDRRIDAETVLWWFDQPDKARIAILNDVRADLRADALESALVALACFCEGADEVWCNGGSFDFAILADAYRKAGMNTPWPFWRERDFRTLKALHRDIYEAMKTEPAHHALKDALDQARIAEVCLGIAPVPKVAA